MSSESSHNEYKIYLDSAKKNKILGDAKTYEKYVILQNETLHNKVNELQQKVNSLDSTIEELKNWKMIMIGWKHRKDIQNIF